MATRRRLAQAILILAMLVIPVLLAVVWMPGSVAQGAATLTVTTTADTNSCGTPCSLRGAIDAANSGDTVSVPTGPYTLTQGTEILIDKSLTLTGAGSGDTIIQAATSPAVATSRVFHITIGNNVAISEVTIRHGKASGGFPAGYGGGIYNSSTLTLTNSTVTGNLASSQGGGIYNIGFDTLMTITNSTINGNTANVGGGIYNETFTKKVTLTSSSVSDNTAISSGGGIYNRATLMTITNSTISGNTLSFGGGGGIYNRATLTMTNSTISGNTASAGGSAGGGISNFGTADLTNTIIAWNTATNSPDCSGFLTSLGYNLIGDDTGCGFAPVTGDLVNVDPALGPLRDNSGPTLTHALLPGSPAIDSGDDAVLGPPHNLTTDQRGQPRLQGVHVDIGAYESAPVFPHFVVNSTGDGGDISPGDGVCQAVTSKCTLRAAIEEANALPETDTIVFNIPGAGPHTIQPTSALPTITDPVIIDGYTQPGASPNTNGPGFGLNTVLKIELEGTNAGCCASGLIISAGNSTVRGLAINRFGEDGLSLSTNAGNVIEGNFVGTDVTGTAGLGNDSHGVNIPVGSSNTVGGTTPGARNVISGNMAQGVKIGGSFNLVRGNLIGTDASGTLDLGNSGSGVFISGASGNIIGGTVAGARNLISGNDNAGVSLTNGSMGSTVLGNFIGTDVTGTFAVGNRYDGVEVENAPNNLIGGTTAGARNVLSGNHSGIYIGGNGATGNLVQGNYIGTDFSGTAALANVSDGIELRFTSGNAIGGAADGAANTIAFNGGDGVRFSPAWIMPFSPTPSSPA